MNLYQEYSIKKKPQHRGFFFNRMVHNRNDECICPLQRYGLGTAAISAFSGHCLLYQLIFGRIMPGPRDSYI